MTFRRIIKPVEKVYWVTDQACTLVVHEPRNEVHRLTGIEQVVWECLILGYGLEKVKDLIEKMGMVEADAAEQEVTSILCAWQDRHLVEIKETKNG